MAQTFTRQELYDLVWAEPMRTIAKRLGVSDVWLRKNCVAAGIPVPGLGYWARRKASQTARKIRLPDRELGQFDEITIGRQPHYWYPQDAENEDVPPLKTFPENQDEVRQRAIKLLGRVVSSRNLDKPHRAISLLLEEDERRRTKLKEIPYAWEKPRFDDTDGRRRLRILNGLFLGLAKVGAVGSCTRSDPIEWSVRVGDTGVSLDLEVIKTKHAKSHQRGRQPAARLRLSLKPLAEFAELVTSWEDKDDLPLEKQLTDVAVGILVYGEMAYRAWVVRRHLWRVERRAEYLEKQRKLREEEERRRLEEIRRQEAERRNRLVVDTSAWRQAADIRGYVESVRKKFDTQHDWSAHSQLQVWLAWAIAEADRIDPLTKSLTALIEYAPQRSNEEDSLEGPATPS